MKIRDNYSSSLTTQPYIQTLMGGALLGMGMSLSGSVSITNSFNTICAIFNIHMHHMITLISSMTIKRMKSLQNNCSICI